MSSKRLPAKVATPNGNSKTEVASGRCSKGDVVLLDQAARRLGVKRGDVVVIGALLYARQVLGLSEAA